ncbi:sulfite exporter TauE/SafE family protein [Nocardia halotolerans]|uniref:Sulfite exporter TauE/SafE family protein n=1 Tax=Nocardia halotolerans TaxID=1755878 RepID=A0ABV8VMN4_9NOCA
MNLVPVLVTGLFAGGISCAAVQGGLLTGVITRQRAAVSAPRGLSRLGSDLAPVGGFLAGKLLSHTILGALLGVLGGVFALSIGLRTWLQIGAGVLIIVFGLAQLGVPGFRGIVIEPPASWLRTVRTGARLRTALAPGILGIATVLLPCGVTLSVAALALATGSPVEGAAIMAVFVLGTGPMFAVLGYAARLAATAWRGRLAMATGLVVVGMGLYTLNGGLELAGSPLSAGRIAAALGAGTPPADASASTMADGVQTVTVTARTGAYLPANIEARSGVPTTLVVETDRTQGCVRSLVVPSLNVQKILPTSGRVRIDLGVLAPGHLDYTCGMGMYSGRITII